MNHLVNHDVHDESDTLKNIFILERPMFARNKVNLI